jgi:hypothetical protein
VRKRERVLRCIGTSRVGRGNGRDVVSYAVVEGVSVGVDGVVVIAATVFAVVGGVDVGGDGGGVGVAGVGNIGVAVVGDVGVVGVGEVGVDDVGGIDVGTFAVVVAGGVVGIESAGGVDGAVAVAADIAVAVETCGRWDVGDVLRGRS